MSCEALKSSNGQIFSGKDGPRDSTSDDSLYPKLNVCGGNEKDETTKAVLPQDSTAGHPPAKDRKRWYRRLNPLRWGGIPPLPEQRQVSPEYGASWYNQITFNWMTPVMRVGYQRPLELNDIWLVNLDRGIDLLAERFQKAFQRRIEMNAHNPLLASLHETFQAEFWLGGICGLVAAICQTMIPFTLRYLLQEIARTSNGGISIGRALGYVLAITTMQLIQSLGTNQFLYRGNMVGAQLRGVLITTLFEKSLTISSKARAGSMPETEEASGTTSTRRAPGDEEGWPNGRVMNMMSTDTSRLERACWLFHLIWVGPLTIIMTLIILLVIMTYSALAGFSLLFLSLPPFILAMKALVQRRRDINHVTDARVSLNQEIIKSVRFVKFYGWESAFLEALQKLRKQEIVMVQKFSLLVSDIVHVVKDSLHFPTNGSSSTYRCMGIIRPSPGLSHGRRSEEQVRFRPRVILCHPVEDASFTWEKSPPLNPRQRESPSVETGKEKRNPEPRRLSLTYANSIHPLEPFILPNVNLSIGRSELVAIIGAVGSGKSSLLSALAGEMRQIGGRVSMGATTAFCPQSAWIQNASVKENILFGKDMDPDFYRRVVQCCALEPDLAMLPAGDETEIGERGINLSGGQKQRLNIARAVYFDSDIILMDDPLSAVDAHVGRHIFDNTIRGRLKNKCRILVTHRLNILSRCDRIVWMEDGYIKALDTFESLMETDVGFRELMASTTQEARSDETIAQAQTASASPDGQNSEPASLMQEEERSASSVKWEVYLAYIRASGSVFNGVIPFILLAVAQGSNIVTGLWLSYWAENKFALSRNGYIGIYAGLAVIQALLLFSFQFSISMLATAASRTMLGKAMARVLRAPMSFFDTTPLGRIINRFSKDVDTTDNNLADAIRMYFFTLATILGVFILVVSFFHYFAIALATLSLVFLYAASYYRASARQMKRYEAVLRSSMFARFGEGLAGTASIRAYGMQNHFISVLRKHIDNMHSAYYLTFSKQRWLNAYLDVISNLLVLTTGILMVMLRHVVSPSVSGLLFSYLLVIVPLIQNLVRQLAEVENAMNATERIHYYGTGLEEEESASFKPMEVPNSWPEMGKIEFENVSMRYRDGLPLVLNGLNLTVASGERIGIVGRTGAGKSSIMSALFRLTELASGRIHIDGVDIAKISANNLRSRLSIIPQDPTLFCGTIRSNLDPFNEHSDLKLWDALRQTGLVQQTGTNGSLRIHLDSTVEEEGHNFSHG
ncbi:hypothetical protein AJ80_05229 [Polytolypa hystricis UAMH7299]|uniref:Uncharacterized protein n=1 Tax=Polytolypa hystricis (strain UAMH7299) TaxID=1447883 RepID=A0A2B7Y5L2_POLH7|nr:hypothetical protein AJ80_05229 [Polytolypa hystricis UAMH7299]